MNIAPISSLDPAGTVRLVERILEVVSSTDRIQKVASTANAPTELGILLEPLYWPRITGQRTQRGWVTDEQYETMLEHYRATSKQLIERLDPHLWKGTHESLRHHAAELDRNDQLYLLLRLSKWDHRKSLRGRIGGSLWFRHIAEVIRRAFEEVHQVSWPEEDQTFGQWFPGSRIAAFGSERPLDSELRSKPYLAYNFGLFTGSVVRWYLEGETEYFAVLETLPEPSIAGIELVNLRGAIQTGRGNAAMTLQDGLLEDRALRRFSMISFDLDVIENVRAIRRQIQEGNIVGYIAAHQPDFEFANFTVQELVEVAARLDEDHGFSGDPVRNSDWVGIRSGREFEAQYRQVSERKRSLKGEEWGRALAAYAAEHLHRPDDGSERPFWTEIRAALQGRAANYDFQASQFRFDPDTFEQIRVAEGGA